MTCLPARDGHEIAAWPVQRESVFDRVAAETPAGAVREQRLPGLTATLGQPGFEHVDGERGQRGGPLFATLPGAVDVRAFLEMNVAAVEADDFRDPQPGLQREDEHRVVTSPRPSTSIRRGQKRVGFGLGEPADDVALVTLRRDREDPLNDGRVFGVPQRGVAEQRVDRSQTPVARARLVASFAFEVGEERSDQRRIEIADVQRGGLFAGLGRGEGQQQPVGVAIAGDGVRAGVALADEPVGEERLQHRRERGHDWLPACSSRSAASCINSGTAVRYQYVFFGSTWPR